MARVEAPDQTALRLVRDPATLVEVLAELAYRDRRDRDRLLRDVRGIAVKHPEYAGAARHLGEIAQVMREGAAEGRTAEMSSAEARS